MIEIGGGWYMKIITNVLPSLGRPKLSKNHKRNMMKLKKLYEANRHWNDWKFQLHWNKLEWVNPIINIKRQQPYSVSSILFSLIKIINWLIGLGINY